MVYKKITPELKEKVYRALAFYDEYGFLPTKTKRISVSISGEAYAKVHKVDNKSRFINNKILS